jgi:hypothetical protein
MDARTHDSEEAILRARVALPEHVVHREFPEETIVLNLQTGHYHGLNPTAGRMLAALGDGPTVGAAIAPLAAELGQPAATIERDVVELCRSLGERGLIELHEPTGA